MAKKNAQTTTSSTTTTPAAEVASAPAVATKPSDRLGLGLCGIAPMRRMDFQDALLEANREMRLCDRDLAILMEVEHPWGCAIPEHYVVGIRRLYNAGKHTKHQIAPATPVSQFNEAGEVVVGRAKRTPRPAAEPLGPEELGATGTGD